MRITAFLTTLHAHYYFKQMINVKEKINEKGHREKIRAIDGKYNYDKKEKELTL